MLGQGIWWNSHFCYSYLDPVDDVLILYWRAKCSTLSFHFPQVGPTLVAGSLSEIGKSMRCKRLRFSVRLSDFNRSGSISMLTNINYPNFLIASFHFSSLFYKSRTHQMTLINSFSCCKAVDKLLSITKMASRYNGMAWPPCTGTLRKENQR